MLCFYFMRDKITTAYLIAIIYEFVIDLKFVLNIIKFVSFIELNYISLLFT